jgi:hypothetical protein
MLSSDGGTRIDARSANGATKIIELRPAESEARGVALSPSNENYWVGGTFLNELRIQVLDPVSSFNSAQLSGNGRGAFVVAFPSPQNPSNVQEISWYRIFNADRGAASGADVSLDVNGKPLFVGEFTGQLMFRGATLANNGQRDIFIMQLAE